MFRTVNKLLRCLELHQCLELLIQVSLPFKLQTKILFWESHFFQKSGISEIRFFARVTEDPDSVICYPY